MFSFLPSTKPKLSVVVVFYNMRREAKRSLFSLTTKYQNNISENDYEVIVIDSNSTEPLEKSWVLSIQKNFKYKYVESKWPSPSIAMNFGINMAKAENVAYSGQS